MISPAVASFGLLSSVAGVATMSRRVAPRSWTLFAGCLSLLLLLIVGVRTPLAELAAIPVLIFATVSDLRTRTTPRATMVTLTAIALATMIALRAGWAPLTLAWAFTGANLTLLSIFRRRRDRCFALVLLILSIVALGHPAWLLLLLLAICDGLLLRSGVNNLSETGLGFGDFLPAVVLAAALGPDFGLRLLWFTAAAICVWVISYNVITHARSERDNFAPVAPALLTSYLFLTLTARLN